MASPISLKCKTIFTVGLFSTILAFPLMAQVDAVMWGMNAAWSDDQFTHLRTQYNVQNNWVDLRKIYYTRNNSGRPELMNISASFIKTEGEDSLVSTFFYTNNNLDSMVISVWDTTTKSLKPSNSVVFTYAGILPISAKFNGTIAMGMSGSFSIYFSYDNTNRIVNDSSIISIGNVFSQTTVGVKEYTSTYNVETQYKIENGIRTIDGKDSTIYNATGKDSINYSFEINKTSSALELETVIKTRYNENGSIALTETFEGQSGDAKMRTLHGYGAMPDPAVRISKVIRKMINKQSEIRCVVNMEKPSHVLPEGSTYDFIGRVMAPNAKPEVNGVFIVKQNNKFSSK